jgi:predicted nucleic acid-binding protein
MLQNLQIRNIGKEQLGDRLFFFDSNVWLFLFNQAIDRQSQAYHHQAPYINFWNRVTQSVTTADATDPTETIITRPVVAITSLIVTETLNAHLRKGFGIYKSTLAAKGELTERQINALDYKDDFRDKAPLYRTLFEQCQAEFAAAGPYLKVVTGGSLDENILDVLDNASYQQDFNDNYYAAICKRENFIMVTDDRDFAVPGLTVLTANQALLKKSTSGATPKNKPKKAFWGR